MNTAASYLEILLEADGFGDLLTRISVLKDIVSHDKEIIEISISRRESEDAKAVVENEKSRAGQRKGYIKSKKSELRNSAMRKRRLSTVSIPSIKTRKGGGKSQSRR